ncbi:DUF4435 domain-containing protein [Streptomyces californicus]|uniref:DUF4435 domain-containing protein n=1 Tax=Streptomyces californicus TaxID=67351 RepID=UPI00146FE0E2|nr:DUF4435 domain-containing protein [Streptomyces californicus]
MLDLVTADTIANEVSMLRFAMQGPIVLVEGKTDTRIYRRFFMPAPHVRVVYCNGKPILRDAMQKLSDRSMSRGVLGICDADYDRILRRHRGEGIFYADLHDAETMICYSDSFKRVFDELFDRESTDAEFQAARDGIFSIASRIGGIRLWNEENLASLKFSGVDPGRYLQPGRVFDASAYVTRLLENSSSTTVNHSDLVRMYEQEGSELDGEMASGHDFCALLAAEVNHVRSGGNYQVLPEVVEAMLRLSFDEPSFAKTELANDLSGWEQTSGLDLMTDGACPDFC